ncbi:MAG: metalloregulator ArsR/SmtB family transcription factor [Granulosicoccus sp.]|nr:metalloregulator ArsR/SmtB family transcription factor [Granulosicoccus sp.]
MTLPKLSENASPAEVDALMEQAGKASKLLRSLSHETRLMILCLLSEKEMSVSEIEQIVKLPQATVSQQLARLRLDKLVVTRREGRLIYYRIADRDVSSIIESLYELFCKPVRQGS